jgi:hypothetical protein
MFDVRQKWVFLGQRFGQSALAPVLESANWVIWANGSSQTRISGAISTSGSAAEKLREGCMQSAALPEARLATCASQQCRGRQSLE